jgi:uncharacterized protein (TIGR02271 family)
MDQDLASYRGQTLYDESGSKVGTIDQVYVDDETGQPTFFTVSTGLFGSRTTFVPVSSASSSGDGVTVAFSKDFIKDAPNVDPDGHLSEEEQDRLYDYYNIGGSGYAATGPTETRYETSDTGTVGRDTSGPETDDAMTRSEEQVSVGKERREAGRARLRKYVVTEEQTVRVPVEREEVRIEREPITEANRGDALSGPAISEEEHEVVLHEERAVVDKEAVPVERVKLGKETVVEDQQVTEEVRKERIEADVPDDTTARRPGSAV